MDKIRILKKTVKMIVGVGTAKIVNEIIKNNVETETATSKVTVAAASAAIGGAVSEAAGQYTDDTIDEIVEFFKNIKDRKNPEEDED